MKIGRTRLDFGYVVLTEKDSVSVHFPTTGGGRGLGVEGIHNVNPILRVPTAGGPQIAALGRSASIQAVIGG